MVVRYYDQIEGDPHPIGAEVVIRGSDVSFYIPRTGLEVVPAEAGYVRHAWRFPSPGRAPRPRHEASVAAPGDALPPGTYAAGTDVFLTDRDGFFFPSENVEVLDVVLPIPIAEKEGVYVRDATSGRIRTVAGPCNFIPDPTREQIVPRPLDGEKERLYGVRGSRRGRGIGGLRSAELRRPGDRKTSREVVVGPQTRILDFDEEWS